MICATREKRCLSRSMKLKWSDLKVFNERAYRKPYRDPMVSVIIIVRHVLASSIARIQTVIWFNRCSCEPHAQRSLLIIVFTELIFDAQTRTEILLACVTNKSQTQRSKSITILSTLRQQLFRILTWNRHHQHHIPSCSRVSSTAHSCPIGHCRKYSKDSAAPFLSSKQINNQLLIIHASRHEDTLQSNGLRQ